MFWKFEFLTIFEEMKNIMTYAWSWRGLST